MSENESVETGVVEIVVGADGAGMRLDSYLAASIPGLSRSRAQRAIDDGDALVNGTIAKSSLKLREGDRIDFEPPTPPPTDLVPEAVEFDVVYEDDDLVVVDKPAGLVVHPGAGAPSGTLANGLLHRYGAAAGPAARPGIVHRLDKDTSGLMVVARSEEAHAALTEQFQARTVEKHYLALVYGRFVDDAGSYDQSIGRDPKVRVRMAVTPKQRGRPALTLYYVLERFPEMTYLDVEIKTGRTHQIRVHLAAASHPVVADEVYGKGRSKGLHDAALRRRVDALGRQFLHAARLGFTHPGTGERMAFTSELPSPLTELLEYCRERAR